MRWEDERYVRLYTRNAPEWLSMSWQARGLFGLILREVDRAGILKVGKLGLKGVAVSVRAPWIEIEAALSELLEDGCVLFDSARQCVFMPNFLDAQECAQSDKARKQASRERARASFGSAASTPASESDSVAIGDESVTNRDHIESQYVTESHVESHAVTNGHDASRLVTLNRAVPCRAETSHSPTGVGGPTDTSEDRPSGTHKVRASRLSVDWEPKPETVERFKIKEHVDALASVERFKNHFIGGNAKSATKIDWDLTFTNWVLEDIRRGVASPLERTGVHEEHSYLEIVRGRRVKRFVSDGKVVRSEPADGEQANLLDAKVAT